MEKNESIKIKKERSQQNKPANDFEHSLEETDSLLLLQAMNTGNVILLNSPGMRIIKTALSVLVCLVLDYFRHTTNYIDAAVAAVVSLGTSTKTTWKAGFRRIIGTLVAGIYGSLFLQIFVVRLGINPFGIKYLVLVALMLIPLLTLLSHFNQNSSICIAAIVFLLICLRTNNDVSPYLYALRRCFDTVLGVIIAVIINWLPPLNKLGDYYDSRRKQAFENSLTIQDRINEIEKERNETKEDKDIEE